MNARKRNINTSTIYSASYHAKDYVRHYIELGEQLKTDPDKKIRLEENECMSCYYVFHSRVGGSVLTTAECGICGKEMHYGNTCVDVLCDDCAKQYELCKRCGGDINMRVRRKVELPKKEVT